MIILFSLFLLLNKQFDQRDRWFFLVSFIGGVFLLWVNNELIFNRSGSYFSGSDAHIYYLRALYFDPLSVTFADLLLDIRYIFYILFQTIAAFPFLEKERTASFLIKSSNWSFALLSLMYFNSVVRKIIGYSPTKSFIYKVFLLLVLMFLFFLATYNFRDVLISAFLIILISSLVSNGFAHRTTLLSLFFILNLRYFVAPVVLVGYFLSKKTSKKIAYKNKKYSQELVSVTLLLLFIFIIVFSYSKVLPIFSYIISFLTGYNFFDSIIGFTSVDYVRSLVAGNVFSYWAQWLTHYEVDRAFVITGIGVFFIGISFFISYFIFIYIVTLPLVYFFSKEPRKKESLYFSKQFSVFTYVSIFVFLMLAMFYGFFYQGMQERIRISSFIPLLLAISLQPFYIKRSTEHILICLFLAVIISIVAALMV